MGENEFLNMFTVFVLAIFVGFYVVWSVTPALHSPLLAVTNAISSVIIVGGLIAASATGYLDLSSNGLTGEIPEEISDLINLTHLDLRSNNLTGEIPLSIGNLT
ncbi:MAG: proton-translocating transhydrogenase family protein, partial [Pseudomonadota bacterium]|nr:proton-translocating transhydrogenase family protein [Pseudomonadota bacterium]